MYCHEICKIHTDTLNGTESRCVGKWHTVNAISSESLHVYVCMYMHAGLLWASSGSFASCVYLKRIKTEKEYLAPFQNELFVQRTLFYSLSISVVLHVKCCENTAMTRILYRLGLGLGWEWGGGETRVWGIRRGGVGGGGSWTEVHLGWSYGNNCPGTAKLGDKIYNHFDIINLGVKWMECEYFYCISPQLPV